MRYSASPQDPPPPLKQRAAPIRGSKERPPRDDWDIARGRRVKAAKEAKR